MSLSIGSEGGSVESMLSLIERNRHFTQEQREAVFVTEYYQRIYKGTNEPRDPRYAFLWNKEATPEPKHKTVSFQDIDAESIKHASVSEILVQAVQSHSVNRLRSVLQTIRALYPNENEQVRLLRTPLKQVDVTAMHVAVRSYAAHPNHAPLRAIFNKMIGLLLQAGAGYEPCQRRKRIVWKNGLPVEVYSNEGVTVFELCRGDVPPLLHAFVQGEAEDFAQMLEQVDVQDIPSDNTLVQRLMEIHKAERQQRIKEEAEREQLRHAMEEERARLQAEKLAQKDQEQARERAEKIQRQQDSARLHAQRKEDQQRELAEHRARLLAKREQEEADKQAAQERLRAKRAENQLRELRELSEHRARLLAQKEQEQADRQAERERRRAQRIEVQLRELQELSDQRSRLWALERKEKANKQAEQERLKAKRQDEQQRAPTQEADRSKLVSDALESRVKQRCEATNKKNARKQALELRERASVIEARKADALKRAQELATDQRLPEHLREYHAERQQKWASVLEKQLVVTRKDLEALESGTALHHPAHHCPNEDCSNHLNPRVRFYRHRGRGTRASGAKVIRYQCIDCGKYFGSTQHKASRGQHRPDLNKQVFDLSNAGASINQMVEHLGCSEQTVASKIQFLAKESMNHHEGKVRSVVTSTVFIEEIETYVQSKHQRAVVLLAITGGGTVLGHAIARIPCADPKEAIKRNWQEDERAQAIRHLLSTIAPSIQQGATVTTPAGGVYTDALRDAVDVAVSHAQGTSPMVRPRVSMLARFEDRTIATSKTIKGLSDYLWLWVASNNGYELT